MWPSCMLYGRSDQMARSHRASATVRPAAAGNQKQQKARGFHLIGYQQQPSVTKAVFV